MVRESRRRVADLMIAAVTIAQDLPLLTINPEDFRELDGLLAVVTVTPRPRRNARATSGTG